MAIGRTPTTNSTGWPPPGRRSPSTPPWLLLRYDQYGNRWHQKLTKGTGFNVQLSFNSNNQITTPGYSYDAVGNLMMDTVNCYTYDAENRLAPWVAHTWRVLPCMRLARASGPWRELNYPAGSKNASSTTASLRASPPDGAPPGCWACSPASPGSSGQSRR